MVNLLPLDIAVWDKDGESCAEEKDKVKKQRVVIDRKRFTKREQRRPDRVPG